MNSHTIDKTLFSGRELKVIILIFFACLFIFFYKLGDRPLWEYDEAKHAQVAKEMLLRGDWITPTFNGENFFDKPVLHFWLVMISYLLFGINEFAARFPSALLAMAGVFLVYLWARTLYERSDGMLSSLVLATSVEYVILAQNIVHDMSLCFFVTLSLFLFHRAFRQGRFTQTGWILFSASLGLAVLAKGPIGLVLPGLIIGIFLVITRRWGILFNRTTLLGMCITLIVILPWYITMAVRNPEFLQSFLIEGNFSRFLSQDPNHQERFYYLLPVLLIGFFPWSTFLPSVLFHHLKQWRRFRSPDILFLLLAVCVPFLFFSLSSTKLATYILPIFPPLSILTGGFFAYGFSSVGDQRWQKHFKYSCYAFSLFLIIGLVGGALYLSRNFPVYITSSSLLFIAILSVMTSVIFILARKGENQAVYGMFIVLMVVTLFAGAQYILPRVSHFKSAKVLSKTVKTLLPPGETIIFYKDLRESFLFYTDLPGKKLKKREQLESYLDSPERVYCIIKDHYYEELKDLLKDKMYFIEREGFFLLVSNKPPGTI